MRRSEFQVDLDPSKLLAYALSLGEVYSAIARSNSSGGGRVIHQVNAESLILSVGLIENIDDIRDTVVAQRKNGTPIDVGMPGTAFVVVTLPLAILFGFLRMRLLRMSSNIVRLAGISISVGNLIDRQPEPRSCSRSQGRLPGRGPAGRVGDDRIVHPAVLPRGRRGDHVRDG